MQSDLNVNALPYIHGFTYVYTYVESLNISSRSPAKKSASEWSCPCCDEPFLTGASVGQWDEKDALLPATSRGAGGRASRKTARLAFFVEKIQIFRPDTRLPMLLNEMENEIRTEAAPPAALDRTADTVSPTQKQRCSSAVFSGVRISPLHRSSASSQTVPPTFCWP